MTQVLIIGYVWPEPRSSAAGVRMMDLIRLFLSQGWNLTFASPAALGEHRENLAELGVEEKPIELNSESFDRYVYELQPDIVLFDRFMMEEQFGWRVERQCPHALRLLDTEDLHSLRDARHQQLKRLLIQDDARAVERLCALSPSDLFQIMAPQDLTQREVAAVYRSDLSLMVSDYEIDLLTGPFGVPRPLLHHCPLMLTEPAHFGAAFGQREHFISIGNFRHGPNWDAVLWLKQQIWPLIRHRLPNAQLQVYGAYPPPKATDLHNPRQGFLVKGWAREALDVISQARVCLAPLRFGAGIKGKLSDAMLCGTPSVTTPIGTEAMHGDLCWPGLVESNAESLASAAVRLYEDQQLWQTSQQQGRVVLAQRFDGHRIGQELINRIEQLRHSLDHHRLSNFTGAMLRHHHHKSTQYMAQWIEAKNRLREQQTLG